MIYLIRDGAIAALEDDTRLPEYEAAGWSVVPYATYRDAWRGR